MGEMSRRKAIGSAAAALMASTARGSEPAPGLRTGGASSMTLADFRALNGSGSLPELFSHLKCGSFSRCHEEMREVHGVWIPELVPVFEQLDAMAEPKIDQWSQSR